MGMNAFGNFRLYKIPTKNLGYSGGALPKPDNVPGPQPGNMQPIVKPNREDDIDDAKKHIEDNINRDPLKEELDRLTKRNDWTW